MMVKHRFHASAYAAYFLLFMAIPGLYGQPAKTQTEPVKIGCRGILHHAIVTREDSLPLSDKEQKRKEIAEHFDRKGLLYTAQVVVDHDSLLLEPPESIAPLAGREFIIARTPPTIEFAIVPVEPKFFAEPPEDNKVGPWSNWSQGNYYTKNGRFYSSVGDHGGYNAHLYLVEYDPGTKTVRCLPEINRVLGRTKDQFGDGKIHGWMDFYDGSNLWFCTYWAKYPEPDEKDYATGYGGGYIMSYNVETGDIVDYGVPMERVSWPYHHVDTVRGILYAVGRTHEFLVWDIREQKTKWAGYLPQGMMWNNRSILIDNVTGMVYAPNVDPSDEGQHFIKYDPFKNRFFLLDCQVPRNREKDERQNMRAHTRERGPDGLFWCVDRAGELYTFDPESEEIVDKGFIWPGTQTYVASMDRSPGGRYLYFIPGAHGGGYQDGAPVVQYDTKTDTIKVIAFPFPYYYEKYGYITGGTYSVKLDDRGERLFILWNGAFTGYDPDKKSDTFGHCSVMLVTIPPDEREE